MKNVQKIKLFLVIGMVLVVVILMFIWGQYSESYKIWFLKHELKPFPSSITIQQVYGSKWQIDYWYIFELSHTKEATDDLLKHGFFWGGDPGPAFVRRVIEKRTGRPLEESLQWELYKRETHDVKMYYLAPSVEVTPEAFITSYLYVYTL